MINNHVCKSPTEFHGKLKYSKSLETIQVKLLRFNQVLEELKYVSSVRKKQKYSLW